MAKYSTPGIRFKEIDNSIRTESAPGLGIGAIVMKSNKGPVNQRIVTTNYNEFTEIFGEPETLTDYGHFAAENYFQNSTQLFAVRATMGDEQYSQIQFAYPDTSVTASNKSINTCYSTYINNQDDNVISLLQPLSAVETIYENLTSGTDWEVDEVGEKGFALRQKARCAQFDNILNEISEVVVFKSSTDDISDVIQGTGKHVTYPSYVNEVGNSPQIESKLLFTNEAFDTASAAKNEISIQKQSNYNNGKASKVDITIPENATLNNKQVNVTFYGNTSAVSAWASSGVAYKDIFNSAVFYGDFSGTWSADCVSANGYGVQDAAYAEVIDWDDPTITKQYYFNTTTDNIGKQAIGLEYQEFNTADPQHALITKYELDGDTDNTELVFVSAVSAMYGDDVPQEILANDDYEKRSPKQVIKQLMYDYGVSDIIEINKYGYLKYFDIGTQSVVEKIVRPVVKETAAKMPNETWVKTNEYLFWLFSTKGSEKAPTPTSVFMFDSPQFAALPIQDGFTAGDKEKTALNSIVATPTSYIVNSVDKTYADGYTIKTDSEDEPGNGDIENYKTVFDKQFIITSIGPGEYGNDIGVSIITTECANIKALNHQNAFNWKYAYDDEDQVDKDVDGLTWKKVFRINVYVKNKTQTATGAWGNGMDALLRDPVETWYVSTDPLAKDNNGNSLYVPTVINGHSDYIYISRSSVSSAINSKGEYQQPIQTYSIYQLTGGKNSTKNNISEKTAALNFYKDRQRAKFDIIFNCDAVDTFNGRQRFMAHQNKIAQIAASRTMDIAAIQTTSKIAKTTKQMISETKNFSFNNGSYVAEYGGYDKYYNSALAAWIYLPKSVAGACAMAYCDTFAYPWMAPAGVARGTIAYTAGQLLKLSDDEIGQLYDNNVNTSRDCGAYGVVLWGQRTALKKNSLLNRINIRRCLNYIEKTLENMMTPYLFMQNSVNTRSSARNDIDSFLQRVQAADGIVSYKLSVTQDEEDPTIMNVNIRIAPTSALEFIDVKIYIDRNTGVTVAEE